MGAEIRTHLQEAGRLWPPWTGDLIASGAQISALSKIHEATAIAVAVTLGENLQAH